MGKGKDKILWNPTDDHDQLKAVIDSNTSGLARLVPDIAQRLGDVAFDIQIKQTKKRPKPLTETGLKGVLKQARKELVVWSSVQDEDILYIYAEKLSSRELKGAVCVRIKELLKKHKVFTLHRINQAIDCATKRVARQRKYSSAICVISIEVERELQVGGVDDMVNLVALREWLESKITPIPGGKDILAYIWEEITLQELAERLGCGVLEASKYCDQVLAKLRAQWNQDRLGE